MANLAKSTNPIQQPIAASKPGIPLNDNTKKPAVSQLSSPKGPQQQKPGTTGKRLCRRGGSEIEICDEAGPSSNVQTKSPRDGVTWRGRPPASSRNSDSPPRSVRTSESPPRPRGNSYQKPADQAMVEKMRSREIKARGSLELNKARNLGAANKLTTGILGTGLASSFSASSATFAGACCPTGMACGSHVM